MSINEARFDQLIHQARVDFFADLKIKLEKIEMLSQPSRTLSADDYHELLRFFHSLNGTAATLGLTRLSQLGRDNEIELRELLDNPEELATFRADLPDILLEISNASKQIKVLTVPPEVTAKDYTSIADLGKILLIDDDVVMLNLLERAFVQEGYSVYICDDPLSAVDAVALIRPELILLDIMMPKLDGYEILDKLKENPNYEDISVVFLTAKDGMQDKLRGMRAGVDDYITKPFSIPEILSRVEMILRRANKFKEKLLKDTLTGAYTRYYFNERFEDELARFERKGSPFALAFIDLDYFKQVNDTYGHRAGDFVLQQFASYMLKNLRQCDELFRYGGEEFVVILPDTTETEAFTAINRLRIEFAEQILNFEGEKIRITFSAGIKQVSNADSTVNQLVSMVDEALYLAKKAGRNRVVAFTNMNQEERSKRTVLLVDDENAILKLLGHRLSELGYHVLLAANGTKALAAVEKDIVDAIILDIMLPDIDGLEVCRRIKESRENCATKIIMLSQKDREQDVVQGLDCGADDYLTKPFSMAELEARIRRVLARC